MTQFPLVIADRTGPGKLRPTRRSCSVALLLWWLLPGWFAPWALALDPRRALTQYQTQSWGEQNGLPCNDVLSVMQSADGYLWLGTEEGLVRFDGIRARVFDRGTDPVFQSNTVYTVAEDALRPGQLLLGGADGIHRFAGGKVLADPAREASLARESGRILLRDPRDGTFWVQNSRGLFRLGPGGEVSGPVEGPDGQGLGEVSAACRDAAGQLWVGTAQGLFRDRSPAEGRPRFESFPAWAGAAVQGLAPARGGGLWVGSRDGGTGRMTADGAFHPRPALAGYQVTALLEDRAGMLWVGTRGNGLLRVPADETDSQPAAALTMGIGMVQNVVNSLCEDREGNLWIATHRGLQVLWDVRFINVGRPEGLVGDYVCTIFQDPSGRVWLGGENGLDTLDPAGVEVTHHPLPASPHRAPGENLVQCLGPAGAEGDAVLIGTHAGLLRWRGGDVEVLSVREDLDGASVCALSRDLAGDQWVGTDRGLFQVRADRVIGHFTTAEGLPDIKVRALLADRRGNLWMATDGGLGRRGPDGRIVSFLREDEGRATKGVLSLFQEPAGGDDLFVGTEFGLHRVHVGAEGNVSIQGYGVREGLFDNLVWAVLGDDRGNLWMSSNKGVSRVAIADLDRFDRREITQVPHVAYGIADGMRSRECNGGIQPAAWREKNGRLWFATVKGAAVVDPAHVGPDALPPPVRVEEVLADGQNVPVPLRTTDGAKGPLPGLAPGTQKLDFRFTALSLTAPDRNLFRYQLEGYDHGWTEANAERTAHYTNLPPGRYRFCVRAANGDGVWNTVGAAFPFRLLPFFYQTAWFRALVGLAFFSLLWLGQLGVRRRWHRRLERAEDELKLRRHHEETLSLAKVAAEMARAEADDARIEAERANAAKSVFLSRLSHELRTPLNAILGFGQLLEMDVRTPMHRESLEHILGGGRHLLGLVDELLDLARVESGKVNMRIGEVALNPLLTEAAGLIAPLARAAGIGLRVEPAATAVHVLADPQRLKQVLLNLLANAVKYNRPGGEVVMGLDGEPFTGEEDQRQRIFIRDTGVGIDPEGLARLFTPFERLGAAYGPIEGTGLGLAVSRQLLEAMGGSIGVESTPGVGSTFRVELAAVCAEPSGRPELPAPEAVRFSPEAETAAPAEVRPRFVGDNLLYIEDRVSNRSLLETILNQHRPDLRLRCAPDGFSGLAAARMSPPPGVILLDLQLPDLPGDEVLGRLRADPVTAGIPVVVLSADATVASKARLRDAGVMDYLTKPLDMQRFLRLLAERFPVLN